VGRRLEADFDLEVHADMDLREAHAVATRLEEALLQSNKRLGRVTTHLEAPNHKVERRQDVTPQYPDIAADICRIADNIAGAGSAHDVHLYRSRQIKSGQNHQKNGSDTKKLDLVLHTIFEAHAPLSQVHIWAEEIKRSLRQAYPQLDSVIIHTEPPEQ
jgi:divalent metal cation (Fe/Co/Zn/Cd) transporter